MAKKPFLIAAPPGINPDDLGKKLSEQLKKRLKSRSYDLSEIRSVSDRSHKFRSRGTSDELRSLAKLANISLPSANKISSHRKYVGWIIVFAKKGLWKVISIFISQLIDGLRAYALFSTKKTIEHEERIANLEKRVTELSGDQQQAEKQPG